MRFHFPTVLKGMLSRHFFLSKHRLWTLCSLISGCIVSRTVNLSHLAGGMAGKARISSNYRRIQRFFQHARLDGDQVARTVVGLLGLCPPFTLCLDRTNWQFGKKDINILMLAIAGKKARIPLMWTLLDSCGNSSTDQRIALIERFCATFGKPAIRVLLADREFGSVRWLEYLAKKDIPFVIRLRKNLIVHLNSGGCASIETLFTRKLWRRQEICSGIRFKAMQEKEASFALAAKTIKGGERLVLVTNREPEKAANLYRKRWQIECLFAEAKTRGLNLEDTRLTIPPRLSVLLAILALACACIQLAARCVMGRKGIPRGKDGYRRKATFRVGFDQLRAAIINRTKFLSTFKEAAYR